MRSSTLSIGGPVLAGMVALGASRTAIDFSDQALGAPPTAFVFAHTANNGAPGRWLVRGDGTNKWLAQVDTDATRSRFALAVLRDITAADVDLTVRIRPVSGAIDQAGGLVWRYTDQDNYYVVRANALENNVVLYKVEAGKRTDLPLKGEGRTYGKAATVPSGEWSSLRLVANGPDFQVFFNGAPLYEVSDGTFAGPGRVGVWTKADSVTEFDDLTVQTP